jgi:GNAT superfamily N-acetyltransferase
VIRPAARDDAIRLAEVHITSWQHAYRGLFPDEFLERLDIDRRIQFFAERIGAGDSVLVSEADGEVVAFCWPSASSEPGWGEILSIYAHPDHWGKGHGRALLEAGEDHLRGQGFQRALLWVLDANARAREFYERQGWVLGGGLKLEEIGGTQVTEVRYEKEL